MPKEVLNNAYKFIEKLRGYTFTPEEAEEVKSFIDGGTHDPRPILPKEVRRLIYGLDQAIPMTAELIEKYAARIYEMGKIAGMDSTDPDYLITDILVDPVIGTVNGMQINDRIRMAFERGKEEGSQ